MLEHLISLNPEPLTQAASSFVGSEKAKAADIVQAKTKTEEWLDSLGANAPVPENPALDKVLASNAFAAATLPPNHLRGVDQNALRAHALALQTRESVQQTMHMLSAYQWDFVEQASQIRTYVVSKLLDAAETEKKPEVRLKALKMLGDVTEVALFTQRTEVVTKNLSDEDLEKEINKRLDKLTFPMADEVFDVEDVDFTAATPTPHVPPCAPTSPGATDSSTANYIDVDD